VVRGAVTKMPPWIEDRAREMAVATSLSSSRHPSVPRGIVLQSTVGGARPIQRLRGHWLNGAGSMHSRFLACESHWRVLP
jgi:hypothetical protein